MAYLVKVNFTNSNKHYNFSSEIDDLLIGDKVVVETIKGVEIATICSKQVPIEEYNGTIELKPILRNNGYYYVSLSKGGKRVDFILTKFT